MILAYILIYHSIFHFFLYENSLSNTNPIFDVLNVGHIRIDLKFFSPNNNNPIVVDLECFFKSRNCARCIGPGPQYRQFISKNNKCHRWCNIIVGRVEKCNIMLYPYSCSYICINNGIYIYISEWNMFNMRVCT